MWLNTVQQGLRTCSHTLNEAVDLEADVYVWHYALLVVHARKEEDNDTCQPVSVAARLALRWVFQ